MPTIPRKTHQPMNNQPKLIKLVYRIHVPTMGTTLEFADKRQYNEYLEVFTSKGWEIETSIIPA